MTDLKRRRLEKEFSRLEREVQARYRRMDQIAEELHPTQWQVPIENVPWLKAKARRAA